MTAQSIAIHLANGRDTEARTRELLQRLLDEYPLDKWRYAETVRIEDDVLSHSHLNLNLNTFGIGHPLRLVSTYIHEQLHWFWLLEQHGDRIWEGWRRFREAFPGIPIDPPAGCRDELSKHLHVAINYWELAGLGELIGDNAARAFIGGKPYYTAVYDLVLREEGRIGTILSDPDLMPPELLPTSKRFVQMNHDDRDWSIPAQRNVSPR